MGMYNLYRGNSGSVRRVGEKKPPAPEPPRPKPQERTPQPRDLLSPLKGLTELIPHSIGELETEDILLMLILYLMYRESGDSEFLITMGAMFLL